ncbi:MAG: MFS transporter [Thermoanaerobaculia bacterium]|nr:MFS transporter [Thermoanaerobaculia bacterium]
MNAVVESSTGTHSRSRLPRTVLALGAVSFLTDASSEMIFPLLPLLLASLPGAPAAALGVIEGVAEATAAAVKVVSGRLSDRATRRKPLVVAGYAVSSAVRPLVALAAIWPHVLLVRFLDRIGKGVRSAPRDALIAEVTPPDRRGAAYGLHRAMDNAGAVAGPLLAAALLGLLALPLRTVLALSVVPAALALLVLVLGVREAPRPEAAASVVRAPAAPLPPAFRRAVAAVALFTLSASSDTFLLLKAREVGVSAAGIPLVWAFSNAIRAALGTWGGGLSDRHGRRRVLFAAWTLYAACYALFAFVKTPLALLAVLAVYSVHAALSEGAERALVADLVPPESRGRAFGWFHGAVGLAAFPASAGFGLLWTWSGSRTAFLAGAGVALLAAGLLLVAVPQRTRPSVR